MTASGRKRTNVNASLDPKQTFFVAHERPKASGQSPLAMSPLNALVRLFSLQSV